MGTFSVSDMKLNIACPETGAQKSIDIDDDKKLLPFFDKRVSQEVMGDSLGDEFTGYRFRITGGNDKQGFPMMQGILTPERVRLLLRKGSKCVTKTGKEYQKAPKIQRLTTPRALQRTRHRVALKRGRAEKNKKEQAAYFALVAQRSKEAKERRHELLMKRRSSHGSTHSATKA